MTRLQQFLLILFVFSTGRAQSSSWSNFLKGIQSSTTGIRRSNDGDASNTRNRLRAARVRGGGSPVSSLEERRESRRLKNNHMGGMGMGGGGGGGGGGGRDNNFNGNGGFAGAGANANGLIEPLPSVCMSWSTQGIQDRMKSAFTDDACKTNQCNGGCCRIYNWLICDTSNSYAHLQCVCNENTNPTPPPSPRPTTAPLTPAPTPVQTTITPGPTPHSTTVPVGQGTTITPAPSTLAPVTPAPVATPAPITPAPTNPAPTSNTQLIEGPIQAWQQCEAGSPYHVTATTGTCRYAEDCQDKHHCCIRSFCLCGDPGFLTSECVPSQFD